MYKFKTHFVLNSWSEKVSVNLFTIKCEVFCVLSIQTYDTARIRFVNCVLYLTVGENRALLSGLLVDVNVTYGMPTVWKNKPL